MLFDPPRDNGGLRWCRFTMAVSVTQSHRDAMMIGEGKKLARVNNGQMTGEWKVGAATNCRHRFDGDWWTPWSFVNVITFTHGVRVSEHERSINCTVPIGKRNQRDQKVWNEGGMNSSPRVNLTLRFRIIFKLLCGDAFDSKIYMAHDSLIKKKSDELQTMDFCKECFLLGIILNDRSLGAEN